MRLKFSVAVSKFAHCDLAPLSERGNNALQLLSRMSERIRLTVCGKASRGARVDRHHSEIHVVPALVKTFVAVLQRSVQFILNVFYYARQYIISKKSSAFEPVSERRLAMAWLEPALMLACGLMYFRFPKNNKPGLWPGLLS